MLISRAPKRNQRICSRCAVAGAALLAACSDQQATSVASTNGSRVHAAWVDAPQGEFESRPRFELQVEAAGSLKPGRPIHLSLTANANFGTADGEVRLTLPEVSAAEDGGWDQVVTPVNQESRPHIRVRKRFGEGEVLREQRTLMIPEPGYYHVIATGYQHRSQSVLEPVGAGDVSRRDYWLLIDERGGRLTAEFDTTLLAPGIRKQSGPRTSEKRPARVRSRDANITCALMPASDSASDTVVLTSGCPEGEPIYIGSPPSATATFKITYADAGAGSVYRPVAAAYFTWRVTAAATGTTVGSGSGFTGADGMIGTIDCGGATSERHISVQVHTSNDRVNVKHNGTDVAGAPWAGPCGGHSEHRITPRMAHLFLNLLKTHEGHRLSFPFYSERIYAALYDDGRTYYDHQSSNGELHMANLNNMVFGEDGVMFATHEYGHSFQNRKLFQSPDVDGLMRYTAGCQTRHPPESGSSFGCAIGEGFADWYSVVVRQSDLPTWYTQVETNWYYRNCVNGTTSRGTTVCTADGSIVQGAVAALLWDISDAAYAEPHDRVDRTPAVVIDGIRACAVLVNGSYISYTGVDHLIWCLENRSPYRVSVRAANTARDTTLTFFNTRAQNLWPTRTRGTLSLQNSDDFRRLWLTNLYSKRPEIGTSPSLAPDLVPSPDSVPDPIDRGCGTTGYCMEMQ